MSGKYRPLGQYLLDLPASVSECTLSFAAITKDIGLQLPKSARAYQAWWANQTDMETRPQAKAWMSAGFNVDAIKLGSNGWVRFRRNQLQAKTPKPNERRPPVLQNTAAPEGHHNLAKNRTEANADYPPESVFLISCVAMKAPYACAARDLYTSVWFQKARSHVESTGLDWFILSAKYGFVRPDQQIEPYELTLNKMSIRERKAWAQRVYAQIKSEIPAAGEFIIFAGQRYREFLQPLLEEAGAKVTVPMLGLTQGRQLSWFDTHRANVQAV